jgi:hypothetical protein
MENIEFELRGEYNTSFFSFYVNTKEKILDEHGKFNHNLNDKDKGTFIHEYIHYIQNISTTHGLMDITKTYNLLDYVVNKVLANTDNKIELPISLDKSQNIIQNYYRFNLFKGNNIFKNLQKFNRIEPEYFEGEYESVKQKCLRFNCFLDENKVDSFEFGAICIKETMAHLIQCIIDPNVTHNEIPYKSAEIVVKYFYPELIDEDKLNIITLCYYSLYLPDSGNFFFKVLKMLKCLQYIPENPIDFYNYLHNKFSNYVIIEPKEDNTVLWDKYWGEAQTQIEECSGLKEAKYGEKTLTYLHKIFENIQYTQSNQPNFFIYSITLLKTNQKKVIDEWLDKYDLPHVFTLEFEYFGEQGLMLLSPIHTILFNLILPKTSSIFRYNRCNKHLFNRCSNTKINGKETNITESYCYEKPWERISNGCVECPFTILWKNLGLNKKMIILK